LLEEPPDDTLCFDIVLRFLVWIIANVSAGKDEINTLLSEGLHEDETELVIKVLSGCLTQSVQILCITHCKQEVNICLFLLVWAQYEANIEDSLLERSFY
jgi:hypothetical protein